MTKLEIRNAIVAVLNVRDGQVFVDRSSTEVVLNQYGNFHVSYDELQKLSQMLGTTDINFYYNDGWCGSEDTPGDPPTYRLMIGVGAAK